MFFHCLKLSIFGGHIPSKRDLHAQGNRPMGWERNRSMALLLGGWLHSLAVRQNLRQSLQTAWDKTAIRQAQHSGAFPRAHPGAPPEWGCQRASLPKRISLNGRRQVRRSRFLRQKRIFEGTEERLPRRRGHCRSGATGRVRTLEEQAAQPMVNPSEMGQPSLDAAIASIASIAECD